MATDDDDLLVRRTLGGDVAAFEALVERHAGVVHRIAARIVGTGDAEDVTQDAFLRAFHRLDRYRGEGSFRSWLLQIANNTALDALRRRPDVPPEEASVLDDRPSGERLPVERLEERERIGRLQLKLAMLRPEHRSVLVLRDIEGLSYDEVARVTEMPLGSVKGRLHRARTELVDLLRANTYDWELPA